MTGKSYKATNVRRRNTVTQNDNRWYNNRRRMRVRFMAHQHSGGIIA